VTTIETPALFGTGRDDVALTGEEIDDILDRGLASWELAGKRVVCLIPDGTRTAPMPLLYRALSERLEGEVASLDWLIALGTHQPMSSEAIERHVGVGSAEAARVHNHAWGDPETFVKLGEISADEMHDLSGGLMQDAVPVRINRLVAECDVAIVVGPVFPHEVVGFSGGNKYFFPGVSGPELIDVSHWLGALITSSAIIGTPHTQVRALIDRAASLIPVERRCAAMVVRTGDAGLHGLYLGSCEAAWEAAATLSARAHVVTVEQPYERVLSIVPPMYADLWTAGKGVYKLEPIVADGGELVVLAPHVRSLSETHGRAIARAGYHCRDYFLARRDDLRDVPLGVLAHCAHVRGLGSYDAEREIESCRIAVTLATGIPRGECERVGLGWRDHRAIDPAGWARQAGTLVVPRAGEVLHRLRTS
jgi:nickel-dependent lactate racemase